MPGNVGFILRLACVHAVMLISVNLLSGDVQAGQLNPTGRVIELQVPLLLGDLAIGAIEMRLGVDDSVSVDATSLIASMADRIDEAIRHELQASADENGRLFSVALEDSPMELHYDPSTLSVQLLIPIGMLPRQVLSLESANNSPGDYTPASHGSLFVNTDLALVHEALSSGETNDLLLGRFDGMARVGRPVLKFGVNVEDTNDGSKLTRAPTTLLFESRDKLSVVSLGEVRAIGTQFLSSFDLLGGAIGRDFRIDPYRNINPTARQSFVLGSASTVDVYVNGVLNDSFRLKPGSYDLRDIPLAGGGNDITLKIMSDTGEYEEIDFDQYFDRELLALSESDYQVAFGARRDLEASTTSYDPNMLAASAFYRYGKSESTTLMLQGQVADGYYALGAAATRAARWGLMDTSLTMSHTGIGIGSAASFDFSSYSDNPESANSYSVSLDVFDNKFNALLDVAESSQEVSAAEVEGEIPADSTESSGVSGGVSGQVLSLDHSRRLGRFHLGAGLRYTGSSDRAARSLNASLRLSGLIPGTTNFTWSMFLDSGNRLNRAEDITDNEPSMGLRIGWRPSQHGRVSLDLRSRDRSLRTTYDVQSGSNVNGGYTGAISFRSVADDEQYSADLRGNWYANRAVLGVSHRTDLSTGSEFDDRVDLTTLRFSSALGIADGSVAIGRPVSENFAIIKAHPSLEKRTIRINPDEFTEQVKTGLFGAALISDLGKHSYRTIRYDVEDLPLGYDLGDGLFVVKPWLGSGYALTVGSAATATLVGTLLDANSREPISLLEGEALSVENPAAPAIVFFTNRTGRFAVSGVAPGDYKLQFRSGRNLVISISEEQGTLVRLGELLVP